MVEFYTGAGKTDADTELITQLRQSVDEGNRLKLEVTKTDTPDELMGCELRNSPPAVFPEYRKQTHACGFFE